jgi:hypothetical protein
MVVVKEITMIRKKVDEEPEIVKLPNKYETLRDAVGGFIEAVYCENKVILWVNEEGKLIGLPTNFMFNGMSIEGDVLFTADNGRGGNKDLNDTQIRYIMGMFEKKETEYQRFVRTYFEEKDVPFHVWSFEHENVLMQIDTKTVVAHLYGVKPVKSQQAIVKTLRMFDQENKNVLLYLHKIASFMAGEGIG